MLTQKRDLTKTLAKILAPLFLLALLALAITPMGCSSNPGIEVGNPTPGSPDDLAGLEVTVDPESDEEPALYRVSVLSDTQAQIIKFGDVTESLTVDILNAQPGSFTVQATFADGRVVVIEITFTNSTVTSAILSIDGITIPSSFAVSGGPANCSTGTTNASLLVLEAICNQVTSCTSITCEDCQTNMLAENDLANELGLPEFFGTFQEIADAVDDGTIVANPLVLDQCVTDIGNTTCTDLDTAGFDETLGNYGQLEELLDMTPVCLNVF